MLSDACPGYWALFDANAETQRLLKEQDYIQTLELIVGYITKHRDTQQPLRDASGYPQGIVGVEGGVRKAADQYKKIVISYEWHMLAASKENKAARATIERPPSDTAAFQGDYMENVGVPQCGRQTSGMFHGSQRRR